MVFPVLGFAASLALLEAFHSADLAARKSIRGADLPWLFVFLATGAACSLAFPDTAHFLEPAAALVFANLVRVATGLLDRDVGVLERWRYLPVAALHVFLGDPAWTIGAFLLLVCRRKNFRFLLVTATKGTGPLRISYVDADQILPEPVKYDRPRKEGEITLVEVIVSMTLLATVSAVVFTAAVQRAVRVRQTREFASVREAAVSRLEEVGAVDYAELAEWDGAGFAVAGDGSPGTIEIEEVEPGLTRITVIAPRRSARPVELTTYRCEEGPR